MLSAWDTAKINPSKKETQDGQIVLTYKLDIATMGWVDRENHYAVSHCFLMVEKDVLLGIGNFLHI